MTQGKRQLKVSREHALQIYVALVVMFIILALETGGLKTHTTRHLTNVSPGIPQLFCSRFSHVPINRPDRQEDELLGELPADYRSWESNLGLQICCLACYLLYHGAEAQIINGKEENIV